jgi:hypothetical protein
VRTKDHAEAAIDRLRIETARRIHQPAKKEDRIFRSMGFKIIAPIRTRDDPEHFPVYLNHES